MGTMRHSKSLEVDEDIHFEGIDRKVQGVGRIILAIFVLAALLGALGRGPLASTSASSAHLVLHFDRITRNASPTELRITAANETLRDGTLKVSINREYADSMEIESLLPEPVSVESEEARIAFYFRQKASSGDAHVTIRLKPDDIGIRRGSIMLGDRLSEVQFKQLVLP